MARIDYMKKEGTNGLKLLFQLFYLHLGTKERLQKHCCHNLRWQEPIYSLHKSTRQDFMLPYAILQHTAVQLDKNSSPQYS